MTAPLRFGGYTATRVLERGIMGVVYDATDARGRQASLTVLKPPAGLPPDEWEAFRTEVERELATAATLSHPGLVSVYEVGRAGDATYVAMEQMGDERLSDRLDAGPPSSVEEALELVAQVGEALDYLHRRGVVHGGVGPSTIRVDAGGRCRLADVGMRAYAAFRSADAAGAPDDRVCRAPELTRGEEPSARADQFSLAAVAYWLLTGEAPRSRPRVDAGTDVSPTSLTALNPAVSFDVSMAVLRALSVNPLDRFRDCRSLAAAMAGEATDLPEPPSWEETPLTDDLAPASVGRVAIPEPRRATGALEWPPPRPVLAGAALVALLLVAWLSGLFGPTIIEATLSIDSEPPEQALAVWLDGQPLGVVTPAEVPVSGPEGELIRLGLVRDDEVVASVERTLGPELDLTWTPAVEVPVVAVRYQVQSDPTGALVRLDGNAIARPTPVEIDLYPGQSYALEVALDGYEPAMRTVDPAHLDPAQRTIDFALTRIILPARVVAEADVPLTLVARADDGSGEHRANGERPSLELAPGDYTVTVTAPAVFFEGETRLSLDEAQEVLMPDLPPTVRVLVFDVPGNASVRIDDFVPFPSGGPRDVAVGPHRFAFEWPSGERLVREVDVRRDGQEISARHP